VVWVKLRLCIDQTNFTKVASTPGIYYTPPKTQLNLAYLLEQTKLKKSVCLDQKKDNTKKTRSFDEIRKYCEDNESKEGSLTEETPQHPNHAYFVYQPSVNLKAVADPGPILQTGR
jgi:protein tyrosine/serine phosphatase